MSEPPQLPNTTCPRCGASNPPHATQCWLCVRSGTTNPYAPQLQSQSTASSPSAGSAFAQDRTQTVFTALLIGSVVLAIMIGIGIGAQEPGMLVPYFIVIGPSFMATGVRAMVSVGQREKPKASTLFLTLIWSGIFTFLALVLLAVAAFVALFVWCIHMLGA